MLSPWNVYLYIKLPNSVVTYSSKHNKGKNSIIVTCGIRHSVLVLVYHSYDIQCSLNAANIGLVEIGQNDV